MESILKKSKTIIINTGNILALNDLTKNPGQNPAEELKEAINITLKDFKNSERIDSEPNHPLIISRQHDDLVTKISEQELSDLKIGLKIFVNSDDEEYLKEALDKG
ncbi:hypothetical protein AMK59_5624 [Oryctes borbonicus]|uniref:Uncharacterized protein n=1 Tax=Oryctes borbonicus TaxID=1629725 RepID=A0A0T6B1F2_9SCAR|nr:hypothetical protein AMK59_5624 [Oryctes borbonicus]